MYAVLSNLKKFMIPNVKEMKVDKIWIYDSKEEAIEALQRIWEYFYNLALADDDFKQDKSTYHEEDYAQLAWEKGKLRIFYIIKISEREILF